MKLEKIMNKSLDYMGKRQVNQVEEYESII